MATRGRPRIDKAKRKRPSNWCVDEAHRAFVAEVAKTHGVSESAALRAILDTAMLDAGVAP